jgi:hypothetical protein
MDTQPTRFGRIERGVDKLAYKVGFMATVGGIVGAGISAAVFTLIFGGR